MRYKPHHKQETRRRIVQKASEEFRAHGFEAVGIAKLMGDLSLTHGGFYAHFADKEALVAESSLFALEQSMDAMTDALQAGGVPSLLDFYLSEAHRDHVAIGCPLPTIAADLARRNPESRHAFTQKLSLFFSALAKQMPDANPEQSRAKAHALFSAMVGAVLLARTVSDAGLSASILESCREQLRLFAVEAPK